MRLYSMPSSGNSYKVRLLLAVTGREIGVVDCENDSDALKSAKIKGLLPYDKVPVLLFDDGRVLGESNAILFCLGEGTGFMPTGPVTRAQMLSWMFWEQYNHEPVIAVRQSLRCYPNRASEATPERLAVLLEQGHRVLQVMEDRLNTGDWLTGDDVSLADICLYAYTHSAGPRGGFAMDRFPAIGAWLRRIMALPGYVGLDQ